MKCLRNWTVFIFIGVCFLQGCSTVSKGSQGAFAGESEGFKQDWEKMKEWDGWMQENMW
jgi:uncharacterized protein YceK